MDKTIHIYLVDDDLDDQEIFQMALREIDENIQCTPANNGVEALEKLQYDVSFTPDYIFIDMNMPKMNGMDCLRQMRSLNRLKNTKIIMYSTTSDARLIDASQQIGASDFMIKPSNLTILKEQLAAIFGYNK